MIIAKPREVKLKLKYIRDNLPEYEDSNHTICFVEKYDDNPDNNKIVRKEYRKDIVCLEKDLKYFNKNDITVMLYSEEKSFRDLPFIINDKICFAYEGYLPELSGEMGKIIKSVSTCIPDLNSKYMKWIWDEILKTQDTLIFLEAGQDSHIYYNNSSRYTYNGLQVSRYGIAFFKSDSHYGGHPLLRHVNSDNLEEVGMFGG